VAGCDLTLCGSKWLSLGDVVIRTTKYYNTYFSVKQRTTRYHTVLLRTAKYYSVLQSTTPYYTVLLRTTKYNIILQRTTPYYNLTDFGGSEVWTAGDDVEIEPWFLYTSHLDYEATCILDLSESVEFLSMPNSESDFEKTA